MVNTEETHYACGLKKEDFQTTIDGKKTDLYSEMPRVMRLQSLITVVRLLLLWFLTGTVTWLISSKDMTIYKR